MGKGDMRTAKGKRVRGTFGKSRLKSKNKKKTVTAAGVVKKPAPAAKPRTKR